MCAVALTYGAARLLESYSTAPKASACMPHQKPHNTPYALVTSRLLWARELPLTFECALLPPRVHPTSLASVTPFFTRWTLNTRMSAPLPILLLALCHDDLVDEVWLYAAQGLSVIGLGALLGNPPHHDITWTGQRTPTRQPPSR
jgi:hypothetical protein